jgi:hypothetical protein
MLVSLRRYIPLLAAVLPVAAVEEHQGWLGDWVEVVATAYSPIDPIDGAYHATKGPRWRWITADGLTDVRLEPYGVAVPNRGGRPRWAYGTKLLIPIETGYLARTRPDDRVFEVDDTGGRISSLTRETGRVHIDLRFKTPASAVQWAGPSGSRVIKVFKITGPAPARPMPPPTMPTIEELFGPLDAPPPVIPDAVEPETAVQIAVAEVDVGYSAREWMLWAWTAVTILTLLGLWLWWWLDRPKSLPK